MRAYKELRARLIFSRRFGAGCVVRYARVCFSGGVRRYIRLFCGWVEGGRLWRGLPSAHADLSLFINFRRWQAVKGLYFFFVDGSRACSVSWQPDCCIGSILLSCLLLWCTQRTRSNLFVVVVHSSSVRCTLRKQTFLCSLIFAVGSLWRGCYFFVGGSRASPSQKN